jgi:nifR3 family TIM-barrel protein
MPNHDWHSELECECAIHNGDTDDGGHVGCMKWDSERIFLNDEFRNRYGNMSPKKVSWCGNPKHELEKSFLVRGPQCKCVHGVAPQDGIVCFLNYDTFQCMSNFWTKLPTPFFALAPMADVTDAAFRRIITKYGKPDVLWTEFVAVDGLLSPGRKVLLRDFMYTEMERPIVAQIFGGNPDHYREVARMLAELGFDGIDINMGCPDKNVEKQGGGASLIKDPKRAQAIIRATMEGAPNLPVSVKTRVGYNAIHIDSWIPALLDTGLAALTIHARTRKEMSLVPARWEHVAEVVKLRDARSLQTKIIGNGDVRSVVEGRALAQLHGADGVMIGRGIFGNPWLFTSSGEVPGETERERIVTKLRVMVEHTKLYVELLGDVKNFAIMKKHYKAYVNGFDGAKELRVALMDSESVNDIESLVNSFVAEFKSASDHHV